MLLLVFGLAVLSVDGCSLVGELDLLVLILQVDPGDLLLFLLVLLGQLHLLLLEAELLFVLPLPHIVIHNLLGEPLLFLLLLELHLEHLLLDLLLLQLLVLLVRECLGHDLALLLLAPPIALGPLAFLVGFAVLRVPRVLEIVVRWLLEVLGIAHSSHVLLLWIPAGPRCTLVAL